MTNNTQIRPMTQDDLPTVLSIDKLAHYHPWSSQSFIDALANNHCWVLTNQQTIIGYGVLKIIAGEAELLTIAIHPQHQGKGFGKQLLTELMQQATLLKANECFLEVRESNKNAYKLYEQYGFNEIGRRKNYYPTPKGHEDALIMACLLD